jgi:N-methylhydantoinase A/oxoprolinase/acetone carboxylase beta subunit
MQWRVSDPATLYTWEALQPGHEISGGAILESAWTTYPVLPGWSLRIDEYGNGHLQRR